jgi:hypothetical protein
MAAPPIDRYHVRGLALSDNWRHGNGRNVLARADAALYNAKSLGRDRVASPKGPRSLNRRARDVARRALVLTGRRRHERIARPADPPPWHDPRADICSSVSRSARAPAPEARRRGAGPRKRTRRRLLSKGSLSSARAPPEGCGRSPRGCAAGSCMSPRSGGARRRAPRAATQGRRARAPDARIAGASPGPSLRPSTAPATRPATSRLSASDTASAIFSRAPDARFSVSGRAARGAVVCQTSPLSRPVPKGPGSTPPPVRATSSCPPLSDVDRVGRPKAHRKPHEAGRRHAAEAAPTTERRDPGGRVRNSAGARRRRCSAGCRDSCRTRGHRPEPAPPDQSSASHRRASANSASRPSSEVRPLVLSSAIAQGLLLSFERRLQRAFSPCREAFDRLHPDLQHLGDLGVRQPSICRRTTACRCRSGKPASAASSAAMRSPARSRASAAGPASAIAAAVSGSSPVAAGPSQPVDGEVRHHLVQPCRRLRRPVATPVSGAAPQPHHRLLRHVLRLRRIAQDPRRMTQRPRQKPFGQKPRGLGRRPAQTAP